MEAQLRGDPALNSIAIFGGEPLTPDERRGSGVPLPDPFEAEFECAAVGGAELQLAARFGVLMDYVRVTPNGTLRERDGASGQVLLRALALARCTAEAPVASVTAVATSTLPPAATATEPPRLATPTPPEGYGPCQNSPTQEADFCSPTVQITGTRQVFGPERLELLTLRVQLAAAPPAKPDHFVGFNVIITPEAPGTNPIERLLSAFSGEEYRCTQGQEGLDLPLRPGEVCGELAGGTLTMIFDLSTYQGSSVAIDIFSIETGAPDGLRRGDALRTPGVKVPCC